MNDPDFETIRIGPEAASGVPVTPPIWPIPPPESEEEYKTASSQAGGTFTEEPVYRQSGSFFQSTPWPASLSLHINYTPLSELVEIRNEAHMLNLQRQELGVEKSEYLEKIANGVKSPPSPRQESRRAHNKAGKKRARAKR